MRFGHVCRRRKHEHHAAGLRSAGRRGRRGDEDAHGLLRFEQVSGGVDHLCGSKFLCDVDLRSDPKNCGACGAACPERTNTDNFNCIEGRCVLGCRTDYDDCDGVVDNGCEADLRSDDHCGSCGNKCTEEAPCVRQPPTNQKVGCGCAAPNSYCKPDFPWQDACVDLKFADNNCGACGVVCDPTGGLGAPPRSPQYTLRMRRRGVRQVQVHGWIRRLQHGYRTAGLRRVRDATEHARQLRTVRRRLSHTRHELRNGVLQRSRVQMPSRGELLRNHVHRTLHRHVRQLCLG